MEIYEANREAMDAGAQVSNPCRGDPGAYLPQVSPLQCCFDFITDHGREAFDSELQHRPSHPALQEESALDAKTIELHQLNGYAKG